MRNVRPSILLTNLQLQAERFAEVCRVKFPDLPIFISPILRIETRTISPSFDGVACLILTSENAALALESMGTKIAGLPALCVGERSAAAARSIGLDADSVGGSADDLVEAVLATPATGPLLHLRGSETRGEIAERLSTAGRQIDEVIIYDQIPAKLSPEVKLLLADVNPVVLPLFSPRFSALLGIALERVHAPLCLVALNSAVADQWAGPTPERLEVALKPNLDEMMHAVARAVRLLKGLRSMND